MYAIESADKKLLDNGTLSFEGVVQAYREQDPRLAEYVVKLAVVDPSPVFEQKIQEESQEESQEKNSEQASLSYKQARIRYHKDSADSTKRNHMKHFEPLFSNRSHQIVRMQKAQMANDVLEELFKVPELVPDRLKLGELIIALYEDRSDYAQTQLVEILKNIPLLWGPWQGFKYIFKQSFFDQRWLIFGVVFARWERTSPHIKNDYYYRPSLSGVFPREVSKFDWNSYWGMRNINNHSRSNDITTESYIYLQKNVYSRIADRYKALSDEEKELLATELLIHAESVRDNALIPLMKKQTWWSRKNIVSDLQWNIRPEPLLRLFNEARSESVVSWALDKMIKYHRSVLRSLDPEWIVQQATSNQTSIKLKSFVVDWFTEPITDIQRADFIKHNLHHAILAFLDYSGNQSWSVRARKFAAGFVREFMHDLTDLLNLDKVLWLLRHRENAFHLLGLYLLFPDKGESPYIDELGLDFWTDLLGDSRMHKYAVEALEKRSRNEFTFDWFKAQLNSRYDNVVDLMFEWMKDPLRYAENTDFYELYKSFLFSRSASRKLRDWAWKCLVQKDENGASLADRFDAQDFHNFLFNPWQNLRTYAIAAHNNPELDLEFDVPLLKHLIHQNEFSKQEWKTVVDSEHLITSLPTDLKQFAAKRLENDPDLELFDLGYRWVLDRIELTETSYNFVRRLFNLRFPIAQLALLNEESKDLASIELSEETDELTSRKAGAQAVLNVIFSEYRSNSPRAQMWRKFIFSRLPQARLRKDVNAAELASELIFPKETFSLDWFEQLIHNQDLTHREFACQISSFYMREWAEDSQMGFTALKPLLFAYHSDIRNFISRCVNAPKFPSESIDIMRPSFTEKELYAFCFDTNALIRQKGMEIIRNYPARFGQPDKLIQLSNSSDPIVRALVVETIAAQCIIPDVTENWKPYEGSVLPQSASASERTKIRAIRDNPPLDKSDAVKGVKYLGKGTGSRGEIKLSDYEPILDFVRRQLFRLPPGRTKGKQGKRGQRLSDGIEHIPTWKNKRTLIMAMRDVAVVDREFAQAVAPLFQEFTTHNAKHIRDACVVALARIDEVHELGLFDT